MTTFQGQLKSSITHATMKAPKAMFDNSSITLWNKALHNRNKGCNSKFIYHATLFYWWFYCLWTHKWYSFIHMVLLQLTKVKPQLLCLDPDRLLFCINNIFVTFLLVCKYLFPTLMLSDWVGYMATMGQQTMAENQAKITRIQCHASVRKSPIHTPCFIWQELTFPTVVSATNYPAVELQDKH